MDVMDCNVKVGSGNKQVFQYFLLSRKSLILLKHKPKAVSQSPVIFLSFANDPKGNDLPALKAEKFALQKKLIDYHQKGWGASYTAATSEPSNLLQELNAYKDQLIIFHFSGHNEGRNLQFEKIEGDLTEVSDQSLVAFLKSCKNLKLVFLNACASMEHVKALQEVGVPAIMATHEPVGDRQAMKFSSAFYDSLVSGDSLQESFGKAVAVLEKFYGQAGAMRSLNFGDRVEEIERFAWAIFEQDKDILNWKLEDEKPQDIRKTQALNRIPGPHMDFVGRADDLEELQKLLQKEKPVLLLNGLGGIGKTTLAKQYLHKNYDNFDHIVWISVVSEQPGTDSSFETATEVLGNDVELFKALDIPFLTKETTNARANHVLKALRKCKGNNLLIIDNAGFSLEKIRKELPQPPHWQVLITSRKELPGLAVKRLDELPPEEAFELFYLHYPKGKEQAEEVEALLKHIGYHTLTLELFAKTCEKSPSTNPAKILNLLQQKRLEKLSWKVFAEHSNREVEVFSYLLAAFELNELLHEELSILIQWAILPSEEIEWEILSQIFSGNQRHKNGIIKKFFRFFRESKPRTELEDLIICLHEKGWVERGQSGKSFRMHQLVQEIFRYKHKPNLENCKEVIKGTNSLLYSEEDDYYLHHKFAFIPYGESILANIKEGSHEIADLQTNLAFLYDELGEFKKAANLFEKALISDHKSFRKYHPEANIKRSNLAMIYRTLGEYEKSVGLLEEALTLNMICFWMYRSETGTLMSNLGLVYMDLGEYEKALDLIEKALAFDLKNFGEDHPSTATSRANLAMLYQDFGKYEEAANLLESALSFDLKRFGEHHPSTAIDRSNLALVYQNLGEYQKSIGLLELSLSSDLNFFGEDHPSIAYSRAKLAMLYLDLADYDQAMELLKMALSSGLKIFESGHPFIATTKSNLAVVYKHIGEYDTALGLLESAIASDLNIFGEDHPDLAVNYSELAMVYRDLGEYEKAKTLLEGVVSLNIKNFGEEHFSTASNKSNLALVYQDLGDYEKAKTLLESALNSVLKIFRAGHPSIATASSNLSLAYRDLGEYDKALDLSEMALASDLKSFGENHPSTARSRRNLATIYSKLGRQNLAKELLEKAYESFCDKLGHEHPETKHSKKLMDAI